MAKTRTRGFFKDRPRDLHRPPRSCARRTALILSLAAFVSIAGCGKVPTFNDLINGTKKNEPAPAPVAKTPTPPPPAAAYKPPEKPKKTAQEVIAQFNATPMQQHTDAQLIDIAEVPEASDQFTELNLNSSGVSDGGLAVLPKFQRVEKLSIDGCQYSNAGLASVAKMKSLTSLSMNGGVVKDPNCDQGLAAIKEMHQLTSLSVEHANATMAGLAEIGEMTWLESLSVAGTRFNDDNLAKLGRLVNLTSLNISFTTVGDSGFQYLLPFTQLETLNISHLPIRGEGLKELGRRNAFPRLRTLAMFEDISVDQTAYEGIYSFKKTLESLDIGACASDDNRFVNAIAPCSKLESLFLHANPGITDLGMKAIPRLKRLKKLYFWKNPRISDGSLPQFAKLRSLKSLVLSLTACSERGVTLLKKKLPDCEIIFNEKKIE